MCPCLTYARWAIIYVMVLVQHLEGILAYRHCHLRNYIDLQAAAGCYEDSASSENYTNLKHNILSLKRDRGLAIIPLSATYLGM